MKVIKYQLVNEANIGTEEEPKIVQTLFDKEIECPNESFDTMLAVAKAEAYNGEVTVEDDGQSDFEAVPTSEQRIAELEEAFELLLSGVTE